MQRKLPFLFFAGVLFLYAAIQACTHSAAEQGAQEQVPEKVSYNFHVRPILSDKCFACHGPDENKREAGLRLDLPEMAFKTLQENPSAHALVPGKPHLSEVFRRITSQDTGELMPPPSSSLKLTQYEINLIEKWIKQGAAYEPHWAFVVPQDPGLPKVSNKEWAKNEIDYFILQKQEQKGLMPNQEADKERLLKRVSLDLTGLPPSLEMMDRFLADSSAEAYENVVDELLQSPAYGEKMALHWLDVARYADSHGHQDDEYRSQWPWRDWTIHAFNQNMPYDKFITWQLAGDLLPQATKEQVLATAFNRNHKITEEEGIIDEEYRVEYVADRTKTLGKALLGVTVECAHCHDHKYDPFSQKEYYQLFAFFNNVKEVGREPRRGITKKPLIHISNEDVQDILSFVNKPDTSRLRVSVMGDLDTLRQTYVLTRGVYDAHGEKVEPATPAAILPFDPAYPKNRLGLAQWLFDEQNPLTSRVFVNRMWQEFFGKGLVKTAGDFGMQGELPSHPELLDWLAVNFRDQDWDIKWLVKQIVLSATYRQSSVVTPEKLEADPDNILLARAPRYRIKAEFVRDHVLASSSLLVKTIGGPSVKPYQPAGVWEGASSGRGSLAKYVQDHGDNLYRRGMYTIIKRTLPPPAMSIFDASNRDQCEVVRSNTNTPLQALVMLNNPTVLEASRVLASRLLEEQSEAQEKIRKAFRLVVCRSPTEKELKLLLDYYQDQVQTFGRQKQSAEELVAVGEYPLPEKIDKITLAALMQVVTTLYNLEETITKS